MSIPISEYGRNQSGLEQAATTTESPKVSSPDTHVVREFHRHAEVDVSDKSIHHTLGPRQYQAASGKHTHDGEDSELLLTGFTIEAGTTTNDIVACLVRLGAVDNR